MEYASYLRRLRIRVCAKRKAQPCPYEQNLLRRAKRKGSKWQFRISNIIPGTPPVPHAHYPAALPCAPVAMRLARAPWCGPVAARTARVPRSCGMAVGKMRTTCFEPYQAYWLELFFDNRKCNRIRLANRLTTRSRFGDAAHGQPVHKSLREKKAIPPKFAISITALFHKKVQNTTTKQKRNCYGT